MLEPPQNLAAGGGAATGGSAKGAGADASIVTFAVASVPLALTGHAFLGLPGALLGLLGAAAAALLVVVWRLAQSLRDPLDRESPVLRAVKDPDLALRYADLLLRRHANSRREHPSASKNCELQAAGPLVLAAREQPPLHDFIDPQVPGEVFEIGTSNVAVLPLSAVTDVADSLTPDPTSDASHGQDAALLAAIKVAKLARLSHPFSLRVALEHLELVTALCGQDEARDDALAAVALALHTGQAKCAVDLWQRWSDTIGAVALTSEQRGRLELALAHHAGASPKRLVLNVSTPPSSPVSTNKSP